MGFRFRVTRGNSSSMSAVRDGSIGIGFQTESGTRYCGRSLFSGLSRLADTRRTQCQKQASLATPSESVGACGTIGVDQRIRLATTTYRINGICESGGSDKLAVSQFCVTTIGGERSLKGANRVNRGGSWNNDAANSRTANRNTNTPTNRNTNNGLRLALNSAGKWWMP